MFVLIFGGIGVAAGFVLTRKKRRQQHRELLGERKVVGKLTRDARRSLFIAHAIVRRALCSAFISTSRRYAPVPMTFSKAVLGSYLPILATACGGYAPLCAASLPPLCSAIPLSSSPGGRAATCTKPCRHTRQACAALVQPGRPHRSSTTPVQHRTAPAPRTSEGVRAHRPASQRGEHFLM